MRDVPARIEGLRPFTLHGAPWVQVYFTHLDDPETIHSEQFSRDTLPPDLRVGDDVSVFYILDIIAEITRSNPSP